MTTDFKIAVATEGSGEPILKTGLHRKMGKRVNRILHSRNLLRLKAIAIYTIWQDRSVNTVRQDRSKVTG